MPLRPMLTGTALMIVMLVLSAPAWAQFLSAIEGSIADDSGAIIAEADVVLVNLDTGVSQTTRSNSAGYFRFPTLPPGRYKITASANGFVSVTQENISLGGSEVRTIPLTLKVGKVTEQVTITSEPPPVQKSEAKIAADIPARVVRSLPLAGRNVLDLVSLTPGVTGIGNMSGGAGDNDIFSLVGNPSINANGQRGDGNGFYVDSTSANINPDPGTFGIIPNPESIQEFHVAINDYSAEFGRSSSVVIQAVTKSGTNGFHGSLFEYHRDNKLTARNVFQNEPDPLTGREIPVTRRNEFGGSFGGPIQKDKMFFFFSWDQLRSSNSVTRLVNSETPDYVNFLKANLPNNVSTGLVSQFPVDSHGFRAGSFQTVADVMNTFGLGPCSGKGPLGMPCGLPVIGTVEQDFAASRNGLQWNVRVDRYFRSSNDRVYGGFFRRTQDSAGTNTRSAFDADFTPVADYLNLDWTHTFSPRMVNEAAVGFTRVLGNSFCAQCQVPPIGVNGIEGFGDGFSPAVFIQNDYHWRDILSVNRGKHALKAGFDIFRDQENDLFSGPQQRPFYFFQNVFDFAADKPFGEFGINYDLRTGGPSFQDIQYRSTTYGVFVQDDWKVKSNLSLDMGLRWDFSSNPNEKNGRLSNLMLGSGPTFRDRIADASVGIVPSLLREHRIGYFAPRLSFAWAPERFQSKLSVRGGVGVFMDRWPNIIWSDQTRANPPFEASIAALSTVPSGPQPVFGLCGLSTSPFNCPFPSGLVTGVNSHGGPIGAIAGIGGTAPDLRYAYSVSRFLGVQYAFAPNWILEVDYLGSHDVHLYTVTDRNRYAGAVDSSGVFHPLNPFFSSINYTDNNGFSNHNSGTISLQKRFSHGVTAQTAFTWAKTVSLSDAPGPGRDSSLSPIVDAYNMRIQQGLASFDIPKKLSFYVVYDVPGKLVDNRIVNAVAGNWELATIAIFQAGYPVWVVNQGVDYNLDGNFFDMPNTPSFGNFKHCDRSDFLNGCLNASDFTAPSPGTNGSLGRNTFRGPGLANVDFSLNRNFHIPWLVGKEGARLQFRGETYNLCNRVNLNGFVPDLSSGLFGKATGAFNPRTLQLGARLEF